MLKAPIPSNERERLDAVKALKILDTPPEQRFDRIIRFAVRIFKVPIATLTIIDKNREWFKSCYGVSKRESPRVISFCGHSLLSKDIFIVPDTLKDKRFA